MKNSNDLLLRRALLANAAFSTVCGLVLVIAAAPIAALMGLPESLVLRGVGLALLPFAHGLFTNARRDMVRRGQAWVAVALDDAWVIASIALIAWAPVQWTDLGRGLVLGVAGVVGLFAVLQTLALRRAGAARHTAALS